jgi:hypothetical protein
MNLSGKEEKFLLRLEKYVERIFLNYIAVGLSLCLAVAGVIIGTKFKAKDGFLMAIFFGTIGSTIFVVSRSYQKFYTIINKMKKYIAEIEKKGD